MAVKAFPVGFRLSRTSGSSIAGKLRAALVACSIAAASLAQYGSQRVVSFGGLGRGFADLVEAVGSSRPIEARLTGGFQHGVWQDSSPVSSKTGGWRVLAAAAQLRQRAGLERTPRELKFLAASYVVLGEHDRAIALLQEAVALTPDDGTLLNDLAAAHLTRATRADRPDDLSGAITYAERALRTKDAPLEASFNVALALEQLPLRTPAVVAWRAYLDRNVLGWALRSDRQVFRDIALSRSRLNHLVVTLRSLLEDRAATTDIQRVGRTLDAALLQPFEELLRGATVVMIVQDDVLHDLPFAALVQARSGQYLAERAALLVVPSAT